MASLFSWSAPSEESIKKEISAHMTQLQNSEYLEQRRMSASRLLELVKDYPELVCNMISGEICETLSKEPYDEDLLQTLFDIVVFIVELPDMKNSDELMMNNIHNLLSNTNNVESLLLLLKSEYMWLKMGLLQIIKEFIAVDVILLEESLLNSPTGLQCLIDCLSDSEDQIRNEVIYIIKDVSKNNPQIQTFLAFQEVFERLFGIIQSEGTDQVTIITMDCLTIINNMIYKNTINIKLLSQQKSCLAAFPALLSPPTKVVTGAIYIDKIQCFQRVLMILENLLQLSIPVEKDDALETTRQKGIKETKNTLSQIPGFMSSLASFVLRTRKDTNDDINEKSVKILTMLLADNNDACISFSQSELEVNGQTYNIIKYIIETSLNQKNPNSSFYASFLDDILPSVAFSLLMNMTESKNYTPGILYTLQKTTKDKEIDINDDIVKQYQFCIHMFNIILTCSNSAIYKKMLLDVVTVTPFEPVPLIHILFNIIIKDNLSLLLYSSLTSLFLNWLHSSPATYYYVTAYPTPMMHLIEKVAATINNTINKDNYDYEIQCISLRCIILCCLLTSEDDVQNNENNTENTEKPPKSHGKDLYINTETLFHIITNKFSLDKMSEIMLKYYKLKEIRAIIRGESTNSVYSVDFLQKSESCFNTLKSYVIQFYIRPITPVSNNTQINSTGSSSNSISPVPTASNVESDMVVQQYKDLIRMQDQEISELKQQLKALKDIIPQADKHIDNNLSILEELEVTKKENGELKKQNDNYIQSIYDIQKKDEQLIIELDSLRTQLETVQSSSSMSSSSLIQSLQSRIEEYKTQVEQKSKEIKQKEIDIKEKENKIQQLENDLSTIQTDMKSTQNELKVIQNKLDEKDSILSNLQREIGEKNSILEQNQHEIQNYQKEIETLTEKCKSMPSIPDNKDKEEDNNSLVDKYKSEIEELREANRILSKEKDKQLSQMVSKSDYDQLLNENKELHNELLNSITSSSISNGSQQSTEDIQTAYNDLKQKYDNTIDQLQTLQANDTINKELINNYNIQMKSLREQISKIRSVTPLSPPNNNTTTNNNNTNTTNATNIPSIDDLYIYIDALYKEYGYCLLCIQSLSEQIKVSEKVITLNHLNDEYNHGKLLIQNTIDELKAKRNTIVFNKDKIGRNNLDQFLSS
ncbi:hypothetical protein WA158_001765 [Blastocystis sp. Blastoise]